MSLERSYVVQLVVTWTRCASSGEPQEGEPVDLHLVGGVHRERRGGLGTCAALVDVEEVPDELGQSCLGR